MRACYVTTVAPAEAQRASDMRSATLSRRPVPWSVGSVGGTRMAARVFAAMMLLFLLASVAVARDEATCKKLDEAANQAGDRIPGDQAIRNVIAAAYELRRNGSCTLSQWAAETCGVSS